MGNNIITFAAAAQISVGEDEHDIYVVATLAEFMSHLSYWTSMVANGNVRLMGPGEYATRFGVNESSVRRFARSALGQALGARHLYMQGETWISLPETLTPDQWEGLYEQINEKHEAIELSILHYLRSHRWMKMRDLIDRLSMGDRWQWRAGVTRLEKQGLVEKKEKMVRYIEEKEREKSIFPFPLNKVEIIRKDEVDVDLEEDEEGD